MSTRPQPAELAPPRLGVLDFNPIQYHVPLYQLLARRGNLEFGVLFVHDWGNRAVFAPEFGVPVAWNDVDLLSGYDHRFLTTTDHPTKLADRLTTLTRWIRSYDAVVIYGHSDPWMLLAAVICRLYHVPYLLRGASGPQGRFTGLRGHLRDAVARAVVSHSAGGLAVGQLNEEFYRKYGAPRVTFAPHSVDNDRFACPPQVGRSELLARWDLDDSRPVIMFCGRLTPRKRPLDLIAAAERLPHSVTTLFVGDGMLADRVRASLRPTRGAVTGFVSQSELPSYYHAADILALPSESEPWGVVVNEAMATGALPVVSDRVGAAPDLVEGVGEVFASGDIPGMADALSRALARIEDPQTKARVRRHVDRYSVERTAEGYEQAVLAVRRSRLA